MDTRREEPGSASVPARAGLRPEGALPGEWLAAPGFLWQVLDRCVSIDSVWLIGLRAAARGWSGAAHWDLLAFADPQALSLLRRSVYLHRQDVQLRIVTDGRQFENAWGARRDSGSLYGWNWRRAGDREAYYDEPVCSEPMQDGLLPRIRRRALRLWKQPGALTAGQRGELRAGFAAGTR